MNTAKQAVAIVLYLLFVMSCGLTVFARQQQQDRSLEDPPWLKQFVHKRIVYVVPGMGQVKVAKNLTYKRVANDELKADVYTPRDLKRGERRPAVIFIHGGRLPPNLLTKPKDWGVYVSFGQLLAASGFIGVAFNHRYYGWDYLDEAQSDVADLIAYVRANADSLGVDKERICLWAVSAGGLFLSQALRESPSYIRSVVAYYTLMDLQSLRAQIPASITDETLKEFSPVYQLSLKEKVLIPIFVARAGLDNKELNSTLDRFVQEAFKKGANLDLINHAQGQHGFDIENDDDRSREIIKRTIDFIRMHG